MRGRDLWNLGVFAYDHYRDWQNAKEAEERLAEHERRKAELLTKNPHMAGFAEAHELERFRYRHSSVYFGKIHPDHGVNFEAGLSGDKHVFLCSLTGGGKGRTTLIQNAIRWPGPLFAIDPKGEMAKTTAMRRGKKSIAKGTGTSVRPPYFLEQNVAILDPLGEVKGPARMRYRVAYNPLSDINMNGNYKRQVMKIARGAVKAEEGVSGAHFSENATKLLAGIIETLKFCEPPQRQTLPQCADVLLRERDFIKTFLEKCPETPASLAKSALGVISEVGDNEWGSFRTTITRFIDWMLDPEMRRHLQSSDFSLWRAMQEGWSIYVVIPPDEAAEYAGWLRVLVNIALSAKIALGAGQTQNGLQTLMILDEYPVLGGSLKSVEEGSGYLRDYGIKLFLVIQNIG